MTREAQIHPFLARKLANTISQDIWCCDRLTQVHPGVFMESTGHRRVLAVLGCAPVSEPAENALRETGLLMELIVLQYPNREPTVYGPNTSFPVAIWQDMVLGAVGETKDVNCVLSKFEVVSAWDLGRRCCLAEASALIAAVEGLDVPETSAERRTVIDTAGWGFLEHMEAELDKAMKDAS